MFPYDIGGRVVFFFYAAISLCSVVQASQFFFEGVGRGEVGSREIYVICQLGGPYSKKTVLKMSIFKSEVTVFHCMYWPQAGK